MPYRMFAREQNWLLPPSLSELLAADHPVRFVAEWVDTLALVEVGISQQAMRHLLKQTVRLATEVGPVDFALQAVDGCRVSAASRDSLREREAVEKLLAQVEAEIAAMEQANQEEPGPDSRGSGRADGWSGKQAWRQRLQRALDV